ncbi:MAG: M28 family peptidase [bacterium]
MTTLTRQPSVFVLVLGLAGLVAGCSDDDGAQTVDAGPDVETPDASLVDAAEPDASLPPLVLPELDMAAAEADLEYLSSAACAGRATDTAGNELAMDYVEVRFVELGLEPAGDTPGSYRQEFPYVRYEHFEVPTMTLDGSGLVSGEDFAVYVYSASGQLDAEVVFVGYGLVLPPFDPTQYPGCPMDAGGFDEFDGVDLTGRIALIVMGGPNDDPALDSCPFAEGGNAFGSALNRGAVATMFVSSYVNDPEPIHGAVASWDGSLSPVPLVWMSRDRLEVDIPELPTWMSEIDSTLTPRSQHLGLQATLNVDAQTVDTVSYNLLGTIPGTDPVLGSDIVILSGHIDATGSDEETGVVYAGTNDNASGTVAAYRLAEALLLLDDPPRRTVLVAAWNGEETGLWGSCHFASSPLYSPWQTTAVLNIEMLSSGDGDSLLFYGQLDDITNAWLVELIQAGVSALEVPVEIIDIPVYGDSDHWCFYQQGMSATSVRGGPLARAPGYHTPEDNMAHFVMADMEKGMLATWSLLLPLVQGLEQHMPDAPSPKRGSTRRFSRGLFPHFDLVRLPSR